MKLLTLTAVGILAVMPFAAAQGNPVTNGGFETLDHRGNPVDWEILGTGRVVTDARSGNNALLLERRPGDRGETGLNRAWQIQSGEQGAMLSPRRGGIRFWYRADEASDPGGLRFYVIPMSADPLEGAGDSRAVFIIPPHHVGDGQWHEGVLKYDFTANPRVKWVHVSARITGRQGRLLLDDIEWVDSVGAVPAVMQTSLEEIPGREGEECRVRVRVRNTGDEPVDVGVASIILPRGLLAEGGPVRNVPALDPDQDHWVTWRVTGRRSDRGHIAVRFTLAQREASGVVEYAPDLKVVALLAHPFIMSPEAPARVTLRLRNAGHAYARGVNAEIRPRAPLAVPPDLRTRSLDMLPPQTETEITWELSASRQAEYATARAVVTAQNAEGGRAEAGVIVGPPDPAVASTREPAVFITEDYALLAGERIRLVLPRADFGYGIGLLQRRVDRRWQTVGKTARLARLVVQTPEARRSEHLVYAQEVREIIPEDGADALRGLELVALLQDGAGTRWTVTRRFTLRSGSDRLGVEVTAVPDAPAQVLALDGPMLYALEGAPEGTRRLDSIFPGLEWLVEGEMSSSDLDIAADHPHRVRYVPHPHMVTIPLMSVRVAPPEGPPALLALLWDHLEPYHGELNRPSAAFASPNRFDGHQATLMGLFAPSMPTHIDMNAREAHTPLEVPAGEAIRLAADILLRDAPGGMTALEGVREWVRTAGVPAPNPLPHGETWQEALSFSMAAYLEPLWLPEEEKWVPFLGGPSINRRPHWSPAFLYDLRRCLDSCEAGPARDAVQERCDRVRELSGLHPLAEDAGFDFAGPADYLLGRADAVAALIRQQQGDGSWRFRARIETAGVFKGKDYAELGPDGAAEVGTCARNAWTLLTFARITGDREARLAGLRALAFMDRFEVPRAAQVWEIPVHTPDILASSDACEAYLEGYLLTGDRAYLDRAVYWAWTGLPFLYTWDVEGFEFLRYASIPVFGATWYQGSWFGRPVQWNGLRYAQALMQLARHDASLDWAQIARGITISAMYQQSTDAEDIALWPDGISAIDGSKIPWLFAPRQILKNVYGEMGLEATPLTTAVRVGLDDIRISATGRITDADFLVGTVSCTVTYEPPQEGYVLMSNITRPSGVRVNRVDLPEVELPRDAQGASWRYLDHAALLEIRLSGTGSHRIFVPDVTYRESSLRPPLATAIRFDFDTGAEGWRATSDLTAFTISGGVLQSTTTGPDPYMVRSHCAIPADAVSQLRIRMALEPGLHTGGQFFWATQREPQMAETRSVRFETVVDGEFHEVLVPLADHPNWQGTITALRLDPTGGDRQGWVRVDSIRGE